MAYEYGHDCPFEAYITNLGKYNEGELVGEWVKFPTTSEDLKKVFERIGIGSKDDFGNPYEEWFIRDYDCYVDGLYEMLGEYENLDELNYLASKLEELDDHDYEHFQAAMQVSDYTGSVKDLINLIDNLDKYEIYPGVEDYSDLGHYYIDEVGVMEIPEHLAKRSAKRYCRKLYEAGYTPICPLLSLPEIINVSNADEFKDYIDMSEDMLRRSRILVVCGTAVDETVLTDIAIANRFHVASSTMRGVLTVDKSKKFE